MANRSSQVRMWLVASAVILAAGAAHAQEPDDCGHPVPERSIHACSALIEQAAAEPRKLAALLVERGAHYIVLGDLAAAVADLDRAILLDPGSAAAFTTRGDAFNRRAGVTEFLGRQGAPSAATEQDEGRRDDYRRAIADYTRAIEFNARHAPAYFGRALAHRALGDAEAAERDQRDADFPSPRSLHRSQSGYVTRQIALLLDPAGYRTSTVERFARLDADVRDRPNDPKPYVERAWAFVNFGESVRALADYGRAIEVDPNFAEARLGRGDELLAAGDAERALADFEVVVRLQPDHFRGYDLRGLAYEKLGERDKAIADYRKALSLEPRAAYASRNLERLGAKP